MRTARSSSRPEGGDPPPPGPGTPQTRYPQTRHPPRPGTVPDQVPLLGAGTPQTRHPPGPSTLLPSDQAPPLVDRHTPVNLLPCPKLRLRAVITLNVK